MRGENGFHRSQFCRDGLGECWRGKAGCPSSPPTWRSQVHLAEVGNSTTGTHGALLPPRSGLGTTVWAVDRAGNRQSRSSACKITYTVSLRCWFQLRFKASEFSLTLRPFSILKGCSDDDSSRSSHVLMPRCTHSSLHVTSQV